MFAYIIKSFLYKICKGNIVCLMESYTEWHGKNRLPIIQKVGGRRNTSAWHNVIIQDTNDTHSSDIIPQERFSL